MKRPTCGLSVGERRVFWRLLAACGHDHGIDVEEHCRNVARTVVSLQEAALLGRELPSVLPSGGRSR